jgi:hypothetical protein
MSLEDRIAELTAAVEANTAALLGGDAPAKKAPAKKAPAKKTTTKKGPGVDEVAEKFGAYMNTGSAAAKKKAKQVVKAITEHFEVERITKMDPDQFQEALDMLAQYEDDEDPLGVFDDEDEEGMV